MTERENHLMFCKFCSKAQRNLKHGIICSITQNSASFNEKCDNYTESFKLIESERKSLELQIDDKYDNVRDVISYSLENFFRIYFFDFLFKSKYDFIKREDTQKLKIQNSKQDIKILIFVFSILTLIGIVNYLISFDKLWLMCSLIGVVVLIINYLILKLINPRVVLTTDLQGFSCFGQRIKWEEILVCKSVYTEESYSYKKIALGTKSRGIIEIDISKLDIGIKDFLKIIELNKGCYNSV